MSFLEYPDYKDSGVEWLGDVPSHWSKWKVFHAFGAIGSGTTPSTSEQEWYQDGEVPWVTTGELRENIVVDTKKCVTQAALMRFPTLRVHPAGSLVIAMYGATIGRLGILGVDAVTNQACCVLINGRALDIRFCFYWLWVFKQPIIELFSSGGGQPNINQEIISSLRVPAPSKAEQAQIARFLDHETARIDALIEQQQRLIELLKEKRQAVISHAVTKGLDSTVPMKDSGVEWLGEVPAHWSCCALKHSCALLKDGTHLPPPRVENGIPLLSVRNIIDGNFLLRDDDSQISESDYQDLCRSFVPASGDVLLAIVGATLGKTAVVKSGLGKFHIQRSLAIFRTKPSLNFEWLNLVFQSNGFQSLLWEFAGFSAQPGIYLGTLSSFSIPIPPLNEQERILSALKKEFLAINDLILTAQSTLSLVQERRSALISAAVTGKIDVRNWQPPAPRSEHESQLEPAHG